MAVDSRAHLYGSLPILAAVAACWLIWGGERQTAAFFAVYRAASPHLTPIMEWITDYGNYGFVFLYALVWAWAAGRGDRSARRFVVCWLAAFALTMAVVYLMKGTIGRARPYFAEPGFYPMSWLNDYHSFPSGHTTQAVMAALPLAAWLGGRRVAVALGLAAALVAFTRVYLGAHFLTDVLGGLLMGNLGAWLAWRLYRPRAATTSCGSQQLFV